MKQYRFTLGRKRVTGNIFSGSAVGLYTNYGNTAYPGTNFKYYPNLVQPGKYYELLFTQGGSSSADVGISVGFGDHTNGYSGTPSWLTPSPDAFCSRWYPKVAGRYSYKNVCLAGHDVIFLSLDSYWTWSSVELYELDWRDPLNSDPVGWEDSHFELHREINDFAQLQKFVVNLTWVGDAYTYLDSVIKQEGSSAIVPVRIEEYRTSGYVEIFQGNINMAEAEFNLSKRTVKANIEDSGASDVLSKGKDMVIDLYNYQAESINKVPTYGLLPTTYNNDVSIHDSSTGNYPGGFQYSCIAWNYYWVLKAMVYAMSEGTVTFRSDYLLANYEHLMFTSGLFVGQSAPSGSRLEFPQLSFKEVFDELDKMLNLGIEFGIYNNIPTIRIEPKSYFITGSDTPIVLDRVKEISVTYPQGINYRTIDVGYDKTYATGTTDPFHSGGEILHYSTGKISTADSLNLVSKLIQSTGLIDYIISQYPNSAGFDDQLILLDCQDSGGSIKTKRNHVGSVYYFNGGLNPSENFDRWKETLFPHFYASPGTGLFTQGQLLFNKILKFTYPISLSEYTQLLNPAAQVIVSGEGLLPTQGVVLSAKRSNKTGLTEFEVLAT